MTRFTAPRPSAQNHRDVVGAERVAIDAMRLSRVAVAGTSNSQVHRMLPSRHRPQVTRATAKRLLAQMMNLVLAWDGADEQFVCNPVRQADASPAATESELSVSATGRARPQPAPMGISRDTHTLHQPFDKRTYRSGRVPVHSSRYYGFTVTATND